MNVRENRRGNLTTFIEMSMPRLENELSCICVLGISMLSHSTTLIFDFLNFSDSVVCFVFQFICPLPTSFGHISYKDVQSILHNIYRRLHWQLKKNYRAQAWAHKTSIIPTTFWNMCTNHVAWAECHVNSLVSMVLRLYFETGLSGYWFFVQFIIKYLLLITFFSQISHLTLTSGTDNLIV